MSWMLYYNQKQTCTNWITNWMNMQELDLERRHNFFIILQVDVKKTGNEEESSMFCGTELMAGGRKDRY